MRAISVYAKLKKMTRKEQFIGLMLFMPALILLGVVVFYPQVQGIILSFSRFYLLEGLDSRTFVGLTNFYTLMQDTLFKKALLRSVFFTIGSLGGSMALGLGLALLLNQKKIKFRGIMGGLALLPWTMPVVACALVWKWILSGEGGLLNSILLRLDLIKYEIDWLTDKNFMWPSLILVSVWKGYPFSFANFLAGLQSIPQTTYEAAKLDGAGAWRCFVYITLPLLRPILFVIGLLGIIWTWAGFGMIYVLTGGGPGTDTMVLPLLTYFTSFSYFRMGYGAAMGVIIMLVALSFTIIYVKRLRFQLT